MDEVLTDLTQVIRPVCDRIAGSDGADAAQESLIAIYQNLEGLREPAAVVSWARRIAVNQANRVARERPRVVDPADLEGTRPLTGETAGRTGENAVDLALVMKELPREHRTVLILRDFIGLAEELVARLMGVAPVTVRTRAHRGRNQLRKAWLA